MLAGADEGVGIAEVDALAVELLFHTKLLRDRIAGGREHLETDDVPIVGEIAIARGKIAENAVANLAASAHDRDRLRDFKRAIVFQSNVAVIVEDALRLPARGAGGRQAEARCQQKPNCYEETHWSRYIQCRCGWMN